MLASVSFALRGDTVLAGLEHITQCIDDFLGPSSALSLSEACTFGSIALLEWIWDSSSPTIGERRPRWSLANFLRSEPHYYRWQFAQSLEVAAGRGDVAMVKWLLDHFQGCEAPPSIVNAAARNGHLTVLQVLLGVSRPVRPPSPERNLVYWGNEAVLLAAENDHSDVARWLYENASYSLKTNQRARLIEHALRFGDFDFADRLLPTDGSECVLDFDQIRPKPELIEWMLDMGYLQQDGHVAVSAIRDLAKMGGHLKLMQQILLLHSPPTSGSECDGEWIDEWCDALMNATRSGDLATLEWLVAHPNGIKACNRSTEKTSRRHIDDLLCEAAERGHTDVIHYLHKRGAKDLDRSVLSTAICRGQLGSVECLLGCFTYGSLDGEDEEASLIALFDDLDLESFDQPDQLEATRQHSPELWPEAVRWAAQSGQIEVLKWIYSHFQLDLAPGVLDKVVIGYVEVAQWLQDTWPGGFTHEAVRNHPANDTPQPRPEDAVKVAAQEGDLETIKRLVAIHPEACTGDTLEDALLSGHVRVARWLHAKLADVELSSVNLTSSTANIFEILLFLRENFADIARTIVVDKFDGRRSVRRRGCPADPFYHVEKWLKENFEGFYTY